jgi:hypothetical protein
VAEWLEVVVAEAKAAMLSAKMLKNCILYVVKVLVGKVLVECSEVVERKCEVVVVVCEGLFWILIRLVVHLVRLFWIYAIVICLLETSNRARSQDWMHSKVTRLEAWPYQGAARMLGSSSQDHMV